jgi:quercetin dioxygenase-like cupin family protein
MIVLLRALVVAVVLALVFQVAAALQVAPARFTLWSSVDLVRRDVALSNGIGQDGSARETLLDYGSPPGAYRFRMIRRDSDGNPEIHDDGLDVVFIRSGEGTLVVGGEMIDRSGNTGTGILGGTRYQLGPGDVIHIPAATPHRYLVPEGGHITYVLVRVPAFTGEVVTLDNVPVLDFDPPGFAMWKASELQQRDGALATRVGGDHSARETLADYGNPAGAHRFRFIHRDADGIPEVHSGVIDVVYIQSGDGTLLVGGEMLDRDGSLGSGIEGGTRYPVSAGDILHIPRETPHGYLVPDGGHVTYVLVRVPAFVAAAQ